jgi:hypothetical protein
MRKDVRGEASGVRGQNQIEAKPAVSIASRLTFHA